MYNDATLQDIDGRIDEQHLALEFSFTIFCYPAFCTSAHHPRIVCVSYPHRPPTASTSDSASIELFKSVFWKRGLILCAKYHIRQTAYVSDFCIQTVHNLECTWRFNYSRTYTEVSMRSAYRNKACIFPSSIIVKIFKRVLSGSVLMDWHRYTHRNPDAVYEVIHIVPN